MNQKQAKAIRQALRVALKIPKINAEYMTRISKHTNQEVKQDDESIRIYRVEQLTVLLDLKCSRSLYKQTKRFSTHDKRGIAAAAGFRANNWRSTGELWTPSPGFFPDCRVMDITPRAESPSDNTGGSSPDDGVPEDEQRDESAHAG